MGAVYPAQIRTFDTKVDLQDPVLAGHVNDLQDEMTTVQATLGVNPQGTATTVRARFEALDTGKAASSHDHSNRLSAADHDVAARHTFGAALGTAEFPQPLVVGGAGAVGDGENPANERHSHPMPSAGTLAGSIIPSGTIWATASRNLPAGWLWCDGTIQVRVTYQALFDAIGTDYNTGGETATQFRLPDLRGRFPMGRAAVTTTPAAAGGSRNAVVVSHAHGASSAVTNLDHSHWTQHNHGMGGAGDHGHPTKWIDLPGWPHVIAVRAHSAPFRASDAGGGWLVTFTDIPTLVGNAGNHSHSIDNGWRNSTDGLGYWAHGHTVTVNADGVSATDANLPPYQSVNWMIKT